MCVSVRASRCFAPTRGHLPAPLLYWGTMAQEPWEDDMQDDAAGGYVPGRTGTPVRDPLFDRVPPHDDDAEMAVLGGMLMSKDAIGEVSQMIEITDFYQPKHQTIYEAIINLFSASQPVER